MSNGSAAIVQAVTEVTTTLGGITEMANDVPTYIPLDAYMDAQRLEAGEGDFDMTDLIFEDEFVRGGE